jgi:tRNA threonylcarbamoyladenosine biosynthesis protein TsaB
VLVLALETSTAQSGVALANDAGVLAAATLGAQRGRAHAEFLAPAIAFCLARAGVGVPDLTAVAVGLGPGLYTGMRVGIATAATLAAARGLPAVGIASLDLLAFPVRHARRMVCATVDARRGELFWAFYRPSPGGVQQVTEHRVGPVGKLAGELSALGEDVLCVGDGAAAPPGGAGVGGGGGRRRRHRPPDFPGAGRAGRAPPAPRRGRGTRRAAPRLPAPPGRAHQPARADPGVCAAGRRGRDGVMVLAPLRPALGDVEVVPMRRRHLRGVLAIERVVYPRPWSPGLFASELSQGDSRRYIVALAPPRDRTAFEVRALGRRRVVGYAGVMVGAGEAHVTTVAVHPEEHRRKIASRLLLGLMDAGGRAGRRGGDPGGPGRQPRGAAAVRRVRVRAGGRAAGLLRRDRRGRAGHVGPRPAHARVRGGAGPPAGPAGGSGRRQRRPRPSRPLGRRRVGLPDDPDAPDAPGAEG